MSNNNRKVTDLTLDSELLGSLQAAPNVTPETVKERLDRIQLARLEREEAKLASDIHDKLVARDSNIQEIKNKLAQKQAEQQYCPHMKGAPAPGPAIAGQRDHRGVVHFICLFCQQEWTGATLPANLRIDGDRIGGPTL